MKLYTNLLILLFGISAQAADLKLSEYEWHLTDVASKGLSKEQVFSSMDRKFIKLKSSVCSNRALLWAFDFKRKHDLDTAKVFLFYTKKNGDVGRKTWWYHVAPIINEAGQMWVVDAGFPGMIKGPQTLEEWFHSFIGSKTCREIKNGENELIERMFRGAVYPETTVYGTHDCYYRIAPGPYWNPLAVAKNLLGRNELGEPVQFERSEIDLDEVYFSCNEASTSIFGRFFNQNQKECKKLVGRD